MTLLADTDVMVDILRRFPPALAWLQTQADTELRLPGFVALELIQGCRDRAEMHRLERHLARFQIVWPEPEACDPALSLFIQHRLQTGIGLLDVMIGLTAAGAGLSLCTFNQKHYAGIPGLTTIQPYARTGRQSRTTGLVN